MIQYTTPTVTIRINDFELDVEHVTSSMLSLQPVDKALKASRGEPMHFDSPTIRVEGGDTLISVKLTQAQSAALPEGYVKAQANWLNSDGTRGANRPKYFSVEPNLYDREM